MASDQNTAPLSVVIPTLNAGPRLGDVLDALEPGRDAGLVLEILVVDGGSDDQTKALASSTGARVVPCEPGRGSQLQKGGALAKGDWILFLHADTCLDPGWETAVRDYVSAAAKTGEDEAAAFRLALDDLDPRARAIERWSAWRYRHLGLPYGDQGLLISRDFYRRLGGYRPLNLMEDVELIRRVGRRRLRLLDSRAVTSAERYRRGGWRLRPIRNLAVLLLYFLGLPNPLLVRLYG